ncbi:MAG: metallophosphoesterase [Candidatus Thorarchaeota archaeon]
MAEDGDYYAVAVSDVHIGNWDDEKNKRAFESFVNGFLQKSRRIDHLIILGDFLDLWRRDDDQLIRENSYLLQQLVNMKRSGNIGHLDYVVGNHDYLIPWYTWRGYTVRSESRKRRALLNEFDFTEASSENPNFLNLPKQGEQINTAKSFVFKHGHQDGPGQLGSVYDELCVWLCHQGNTSGLITSVIWKYKTYLPALVSSIFLFLSTWQFFLGHILWSALFIVVAAALILLSLWMMRSEELKIRKLPQSTRKEIKVQQTEVMASDRGYYEEEVWQYFPTEQREKIMSRIEKIKQNIAPLDEQVSHIVGHTHVPEEGPPKWNLGSWIEGEDYPYLTIDRNGGVKLLRWSYHE